METQLLYFTATWCAPCKVFGPRMDRVSKFLDLALVKIDADEQYDMVEEFKVMSIPTVVVMRDGLQADRFVGARSEDELLALLTPYVN